MFRRTRNPRELAERLVMDAAVIANTKLREAHIPHYGPNPFTGNPLYGAVEFKDTGIHLTLRWRNPALAERVPPYVDMAKLLSEAFREAGSKDKLMLQVIASEVEKRLIP